MKAFVASRNALPNLKHLLFTVTNNLVYDQRMIRICQSLTNNGYRVTLVGARQHSAPPLLARPFAQHRLFTWFKRGPGFYAEYNCRLFFYLLFHPSDLVCCIDLDTILPVWLVTSFTKRKRVYDAHEYFSQQKEIITRPAIYRTWHWIERQMMPRFPNGYTVGEQIAKTFEQLYGIQYIVIRNVPLLKNQPAEIPPLKIEILYQGAVNEGRGLEFLVPAMKHVEAKLHIYGDGNYLEQTKLLIESNNLQHKVFLKGKLIPEALSVVTSQAYIGVNLVENKGLNQYYSLANKFFDYIHHLVPQVTMDFPEYRNINDQYPVAVLADNLEPSTIAACINQLLTDESLHSTLRENCRVAREHLNWQQEELKLIAFYKRVMESSK